MERQPEILKRAAEMARTAREKNEKEETERIDHLAHEICYHIMDSVNDRILNEASKGETRLVVMGLAADDTKKSVPGLDRYLNPDYLFAKQAFDLVFAACEKAGLNPKKVTFDTYYGEEISAVHQIVIEW